MIKLLKKLRNSKRGFSLVELIVVIAIMAVIAAVLVPSLLMHVEESRAEKDVKTTDEVVTAVELALADQDVYDELVEHSVFDNVSCYVDKDSEAGYERVVIKETYNGYAEQYMFDDDARQNDEVPYYGAGNMRGLTITFSPDKDSNESTYDLARAIINRFVGRKTGYLYENEKLYNAIRSVVGDKIYNSSQTYRNSDFTIFIRLGSAGGNEAGNQDATQVWGQYNGTNLPSDTVQTAKITTDRAIGDAGQYDASVNEYINDETNTDIDFSQLAAMGNSNFGAKLEEENKVWEPGVYDENNNLIKTWTQIGVNISVATNPRDNKFVSAIGTNAVKLVLPDTVKTIGNYQFNNSYTHMSSPIKELIISSSLNSFNKYAFSGCGNLEKIKVDKNNPKYDSRDNCNAIIETSTNKLVRGCKNTIIPSTVTSIGTYAFWECRGMTSITIPKTVTSIKQDAFHYCDDLTEVIFEGTKNEWRTAIGGLMGGTGYRTIPVKCSDGTLTKNGQALNIYYKK